MGIGSDEKPAKLSSTSPMSERRSAEKERERERMNERMIFI